MTTKFIKVNGKDRLVYTLQMMPDSAQARMIRKYGSVIANRSEFYVENGCVIRIEAEKLVKA